MNGNNAVISKFSLFLLYYAKLGEQYKIDTYGSIIKDSDIDDYMSYRNKFHNILSKKYGIVMKYEGIMDKSTSYFVTVKEPGGSRRVIFKSEKKEQQFYDEAERAYLMHLLS